MKKFKIQRGKAKKGEGRSLKEGGRDLGNEEFVIWYVCFAIKSAISQLNTYQIENIKFGM